VPLWLRAEREAAREQRRLEREYFPNRPPPKKEPQPPISPLRGSFAAPPAAAPAAQGVAPAMVAAGDAPEPQEEKNHAEAAGAAGGSATPAAGSGKPRLNDEEIARVLTYIECGYSLRQAAAAVGRRHGSVLRYIRRRPDLVEQYRQQRALARERPLRRVHEASQRSWRAAAWLLSYLDRQQPGVSRSRSERRNRQIGMSCPK
jgi:hypothetical protein